MNKRYTNKNKIICFTEILVIHVYITFFFSPMYLVYRQKLFFPSCISFKIKKGKTKEKRFLYIGFNREQRKKKKQKR